MAEVNFEYSEGDAISNRDRRGRKTPRSKANGAMRGKSVRARVVRESKTAKSETRNSRMPFAINLRDLLPDLPSRVVSRTVELLGNYHKHDFAYDLSFATGLAALVELEELWVARIHDWDVGAAFSPWSVESTELVEPSFRHANCQSTGYRYNSPDPCLPAKHMDELSMPLLSLSKHLLAKYEVPWWLWSAFQRYGSVRRVPERLWFAHVGMGGNLRDAPRLPVKMSTRMAAFAIGYRGYCRLPASARLAIRYGQLRAAGVDESIVLEFLMSIPLETAPREGFWTKFIEWVGSEQNGYGHGSHYFLGPRYYIPADGETFELRCAELRVLTRFLELWRLTSGSDYDFKGRTITQVLHEARDWERRKINMRIFWNPTGLGDWTCQSEHGTFRIDELTKGIELIDEGVHMQHCVGDYVDACVQGHCRIFSLKQRSSNGEFFRVATLRLSTEDLSILEVRGIRNTVLEPSAEWAIDRFIAERVTPHGD